MYKDYLIALLMLQKLHLFDISRGHRYSHTGKPLLTMQIKMDDYMKRLILERLYKSVR